MQATSVYIDNTKLSLFLESIGLFLVWIAVDFAHHFQLCRREKSLRLAETTI